MSQNLAAKITGGKLDLKSHYCQWFAYCTNQADRLRRGPIGGGEFGDVPICKRCDDRMEEMS